MDLKLREAARTGNIGDLYALIQEDPRILERIDEIPFVDTPFHIASIEGHIKFAMEMMNLKPSFARKLNQDGFSPMHLALSNRHTQLVRRLVKTDKDLVRVKGKEGMTPLHSVVQMGDSNLLYEFLGACPQCIEDVTVEGKTALHLILESDQMEAFKLLIGWLQSNLHGSASNWEREIVNWKDNEDNTVLHIAAGKENLQALKLLLNSFIWLDVKVKNLEGLTAKEILQKVEGKAMNNGEENDSKIKHLKKQVNFYGRLNVLTGRAKKRLSGESLNALLVVTALVITATYQSSLSPPGGLWQGDNSSTSNITTSNAWLGDNSSTSNITTSNATLTTHHHNLIAAAHDGEYNLYILKGMLGNESRKAGTTIMNPDSYALFWVLNSSNFGFTILLTGFLLFSVPLLLFLLFPLYYLGINYLYSMKISSPSTTWSNINIALFVVFEYLPPLVLLIIVYTWRIKSQQKDRTNFLKVLDKGNNVGIIQRLGRAIKFTLYA